MVIYRNFLGSGGGWCGGRRGRRRRRWGRGGMGEQGDGEGEDEGGAGAGETEESGRDTGAALPVVTYAPCRRAVV